LEDRELKKCTDGIKDNIKILIDKGMLDEAKDALQEYEGIVKDDSDIYSMRGIIAIIEEDFDKAEEMFNEGLLKNSNSCDLLFNISLLYKSTGKLDKFIYFYKRLYYRTENQDEKKTIEGELKELGVNLKNKVLIGSPICQKPQILNEFLQSLNELNKEDLDVDYFFVDDNKNEKSSIILSNFATENKNVLIKESKREDSEYICDRDTHYWKESLVWKVAGFKDSIIKYAKDNSYDYLFFIDSDLVLDSSTLKHLISTGKDIISEVFWTKWNADSLELPQVWLKDHYSMYKSIRGEKLSNSEIQNRQNEFITELRIPGIYEVGGLGACTLISKYAIDKGVCFKEIKNISFWGEDRHFCIRASSLGLPLYVDTHYPAYHIYRESDLSGVFEYKEKKKLSITAPVYHRYNKSNEITLSMVVRNEAGKYLEEMLLNARKYINRAVIIDDESTDNTVEIIKRTLTDIPLTLIQNKKSRFSNEINLRKQQWEETIKTNPSWIISLDADEMFESRFADDIHTLINQDDYDVFCFRLFDFWEGECYREDEYWRAHLNYRAFLIRYRDDFDYKWKETAQHCGRFPMNITQLPTAKSDLRLKHYGWANAEDRRHKYERYMLLDPDSRYGWKEQYESILDEKPNLVKWLE